jgi:cell division septation protein DedD
MRTFIKSVCFLVTLSLTPAALANYEVERLMDSYLIAKVDTTQSPHNDSEAKKMPYAIQVASYVNEKDAASHVEELRTQEKNVTYFPAFVSGQVLFKVIVGQFDSKAKAEEYRRGFMKRMDEPFTSVISLLEKPKKSDTKTAQKEVANIEKRKPASVAKKEDTPVPAGEPAAVTAAVPAPVVKLIPKKVEPAATSDSTYSIQVGAFPSETLAKEKQAALQVKDAEVYYQPAMVADKQWFRLFIGKFKSKKDAEIFQKTLKEQMQGGDSFIRKVSAAQ